MEKKPASKAPVKNSSSSASSDMLPPPEFQKLVKLLKKLNNEQIGALFIGVVFVIFIIPFSVIATLDDTDSRSRAYVPRPVTPPWTPPPPVTPPWTPRPTPDFSPWPTPRYTPRPTSWPTPRTTPVVSPWPTPRPTPYPTPRVSPRPLPTITPIPIGPNNPPQIITRTLKNATINRFYQTTVSASDTNLGDIVTIDLDGLPPGIRKGVCSTRQITGSHSVTTCTITGTPTTAGTFRVSIAASDNRGGVTKLTTTLKVTGGRFRWPWEPPIPLPTPIVEAR